LRAQARSLGTSADTHRLQHERVAELGIREAGLTALTDERTRLVEERAVHTAFLSSPPDPGPPDAHLRSVSQRPSRSSRTPPSCDCGQRLAHLCSSWASACC
jgi:hypothetical protein